MHARTGATLEPFGDGTGSVVYYDLEEREEKTVIEGVRDFVLAAKGDKILAVHRRLFADDQPRYFTGVIDGVMIFERALTEADFVPPTGGYKVVTEWEDSGTNSTSVRLPKD